MAIKIKITKASKNFRYGVKMSQSDSRKWGLQLPRPFLKERAKKMNIQLFGAKKLHRVRDIILKDISFFGWTIFLDFFDKAVIQKRKQKTSFLDNFFLIG